jgi:hypothetical protein
MMGSRVVALKERRDAVYVVTGLLVITSRICINSLGWPPDLPTVHGFREAVEAPASTSRRWSEGRFGSISNQRRQLTTTASSTPTSRASRSSRSNWSSTLPEQRRPTVRGLTATTS